ncbi:MAG: hypothetical protein U9R40_00785 [Synergistota bacterium]|nr:hypothetical protein [Synergistota bacterium]
MQAVCSVFVICCFICDPVQASGALEMGVVNPWLSKMVSFIGGIHLKTLPLTWWNDAGQEKPTGKIPAEVCVLAIDEQSARRYISGQVDSSRLRLLFRKAPETARGSDAMFLDPAALPFLAIRVMTEISSCDPSHYDYYQRRLAEFQGRLDSTVMVGRQMIGAIEILDLSWVSGEWIQAASGYVVQPPPETRLAWLQGRDMESLDTALAEAVTRDWLVVVDAWTPEAVKSRIPRNVTVVALPVIMPDEDFFLYLYDLYLTIWETARVSGAGS